MTFIERVSPWIIPALLAAIPLYGYARGVKVYEVFVQGAREGFDVGVRIIPYLVAVLAAVGAFKASGALDVLQTALGPYTAPLGLPPQVIPMALVRPLSGSGATGVMAGIFQTDGPDSYAGRLASVLMGSTETTFYVIAVYGGAVGLKQMRHAIAAGLVADAVGVIASVAICRALWG